MVVAAVVVVVVVVVAETEVTVSNGSLTRLCRKPSEPQSLASVSEGLPELLCLVVNLQTNKAIGSEAVVRFRLAVT